MLEPSISQPKLLGTYLDGADHIDVVRSRDQDTEISREPMQRRVEMEYLGKIGFDTLHHGQIVHRVTTN